MTLVESMLSPDSHRDELLVFSRGPPSWLPSRRESWTHHATGMPFRGAPPSPHIRASTDPCSA